MNNKETHILPATGKLGILVVGCGAVATTLMTGVLMVRKGLARPIGSMTQMDKIRVGSGKEARYLKYADIVPMASLDDIVFGAWDVYPQNAYQAAMYAQVLDEKDIAPVRQELEQIVPMTAAFDRNYVKRIDGDNIKVLQAPQAPLSSPEGDTIAKVPANNTIEAPSGAVGGAVTVGAEPTRWQMVEMLRDDIRRFRREHGCSRIVVLWAASTEIYVPVDEQVHYRLEDLEAAMQADDRRRVAPSMCYAYAALREGCPFIMGAPNTTVDIPAMWQLAAACGVPISGKDFKTGQTLVKSGFAPIISTRCLALDGWFSTNILGNRDGLVLDEPQNFHTKEVSKLSTLETILDGSRQPELYGDYYHKVRINYYPPRNDNKESWDNIDLRGWLDYPMQVKINFLCRDSILAAPVALDLCLLSDLAARAGCSGTQRWLSFFLKSPMHDYTRGEQPVNHLYQQYTMLKNKLRELGGYEADEAMD